MKIVLSLSSDETAMPIHRRVLALDQGSESIIDFAMRTGCGRDNRNFGLYPLSVIHCPCNVLHKGKPQN